MKKIVCALLLASMTLGIGAAQREGNPPGGPEGTQADPRPPLIDKDKVQNFSAFIISVAGGVAAHEAKRYVDKALTESVKNNKGTWKGWLSELCSPAAKMGAWVIPQIIGYCLASRILDKDDHRHLPIYIAFSIGADTVTDTGHEAWKQYHACHEQQTKTNFSPNHITIAQNASKK